jgi:hypothetical protein
MISIKIGDSRVILAISGCNIKNIKNALNAAIEKIMKFP